MSEQPIIVQYKQEINTQLADKQILESLVRTTFRGLNMQQVKSAMLEGYQLGFKFQDFLKKKVYAIPFKQNYQLITAISWAREIGQKNGIVGKSKPTYEDTNGKIVSCTITVKKKRKGDDYIGDYTATVYFDEYYKPQRNGKPGMWDTKPRTMIAKVAEMHALRMACPEDLSHFYTEEEFQKELQATTFVAQETDTTEKEAKLRACKTVNELREVWTKLTAAEKEVLLEVKNEMKVKLGLEQPPIEGELVN